MLASEGLGGGDGEDVVYVLPTFVHLFVGLAGRLFQTAEAGGVDREVEEAVKTSGYPFRLVVTALFLFLRMKGDGDNQVGEVRPEGFLVVKPCHTSQTKAYLTIAVILQSVDKLLYVTALFVTEESGSPFNGNLTGKKSCGRVFFEISLRRTRQLAEAFQADMFFTTNKRFLA